MRAYECLFSGFPGIYALRLFEKAPEQRDRVRSGA
jgi:hypothetical protein